MSEVSAASEVNFVTQFLPSTGEQKDADRRANMLLTKQITKMVREYDQVVSFITAVCSIPLNNHLESNEYH